MSEQFYGLTFAIFSMALGFILYFFSEKIVTWQGESKKGDYSIEQRKSTLKAVGITAFLVGIFFFIEYF